MNRLPELWCSRTGRAFRGRLHGYARSVSGEVVFNTGMVGYTEALTDLRTAARSLRSRTPWWATTAYRRRSNPEGSRPPPLSCPSLRLTTATRARKAACGLAAPGRDSLPGRHRYRALTKRLRDKGAMLGKIVLDGEDVPFDDPNCRDLVAEVGSRERIVYPGGERTVVLVDCGAKASIIEKLRARGLTIIRVPSDYDFLGEDFDGVLVSNGPGDPRSCGEDHPASRARAARQASHHGHLPWAPAPRARRRREHLQAQVRAPRP